MKSLFDSLSLFVQMVIAFIAVVFLASVAIGVPSIWLLKDQLNRQAWAQIDQGQRITLALYDFQHNEIFDLATITAQRPTLQELITERDVDRLSSYLITLEEGAGLDGVFICDAHGQLFAGTINGLEDAMCAAWKNSRYYYEQNSKKVFLTASHPIEDNNVFLGEVFVLRDLDTGFVSELFDQTGLEHLLWQNDRLIASSITEMSSLIEMAASASGALGQGKSERTLEINGVTYYSGHFSLNSEGLSTDVMLDVTELVATQARLIRNVVISILSVSLIGSLLGVLLVRRINRPLVQLTEAAARFGSGDMVSPVEIETGLREISQVAVTLENARSDLLATLTSLEKERDWSEHLLASIVEGIITIDDELNITFFSHGAEGILGIGAEGAIGRSVDEVFRLSDDQQVFKDVLSDVLDGRQKVDVLLPDHPLVSLAITGARVTRREEGKSEIALVFRDVSKEEAVHRLLGQFLANVAHEFRTPLSALEASIELLLDQAPDLNRNELLELHTSIHLGVLGLHTLVDNLLESANIEARRFQISPKPCSLRDVIAEAVQMMQPLLSKYGQNLTIELPLDDLMVKADPRRTVQVLINLISNASRYGPPNEEILISVKVGGKYALVEVMDRGPGIPTEDRLNLFRRFVFPQTSVNISTAGAGLGLSVVEAIVTAHGGEVGVEDRPGTGSIFWFTLPLDEEQ